MNQKNQSNKQNQSSRPAQQKQRVDRSATILLRPGIRKKIMNVLWLCMVSLVLFFTGLSHYLGLFVELLVGDTIYLVTRILFGSGAVYYCWTLRDYILTSEEDMRGV